MFALRVASISLALISGCALDDEPVTTDVEQQIPIFGGCDEWGCGLNGPEIDHLGIHDLHGQVGGNKNANGFFISKIEQTTCTPICSTKFFDKVVSKNGVLTATGPGGVVTGANIKGLVIRLSNALNGAKYVLTVADVGRNVRMWARITGFESWPQYTIQWDVQRPPGTKQEWKAVCKNPPSENSPDLLGMNAYQSVFFENDEIDARRKVVKGLRFEEGWWNIGCAGHPLAKMQLMGMTSAGGAKFGMPSTWDDKTAAIKMITNDICGTGYAFTVAGQQIGWADKNAWNKYLQGPAYERESVWTNKGAKCLNEPRILANPTPIGIATFPNLEDLIKAECGGDRPPHCADLDPYNFEGQFWITSNP